MTDTTTPSDQDTIAMESGILIHSYCRRIINAIEMNEKSSTKNDYYTKWIKDAIERMYVLKDSL